MRNLLAALVFAALTAVAGCGGVTPTDAPADQSQSALAVTVGTHRATGSYTCQLTPFSSATFAVSAYVYLAQTAPGRWGMYISNDLNHGAGITMDIRDSSPLEAADNGAVVYNLPADTLYLHRLMPFAPIEYTHDMSVPSYQMQFWPADATHPLGQFVIWMFPQGASDPSKGECQATIYLTLQP